MPGDSPQRLEKPIIVIGYVWINQFGMNERFNFIKYKRVHNGHMIGFVGQNDPKEFDYNVLIENTK